ncbi:MAG: AraC family transcriptional regulator [Pseudomonadota bacterium]
MSTPFDQLDTWLPHRLATVDRLLEPFYLERFRDSLVSDLILRLWAEAACGDHVSRLFVDGAIQSIMAALLRNFGVASSKSPIEPGDPRLRRVIDYVDANLTNDLALPELADIACLSTYHFARAFKRALGQSPHAFVLDQRIGRAKDLLTKTKLPIAFVARDCGFASQSHMTAVFRRYCATTPRQYRQSRQS